MDKQAWWSVVKKIHNDEEGAVSLETVLVIGAIAIPVLIFLIKVGWPMIRDYFKQGVKDLQTDANSAQQ